MTGWLITMEEEEEASPTMWRRARRRERERILRIAMKMIRLEVGMERLRLARWTRG